MESALANIRIVLVEPAGALNVGSIARVMKNMGLGCLVLVNPRCDHLSSEARQMAVHAGSVLESARVVESLPEGLGGCHWAIATTGKPRTLAATLESPKMVLPALLHFSQQGDAALIFGPEDRGLNNTELNYAQRFLSIPSSPEYPSLNLAQAVAICCYELYQLALTKSGDGTTHLEQEGTLAIHSSPPPSPAASAAVLPPGSPRENLAPLDMVEAFYQHLEAVLLKIGYLYPHTADSRMQKFRRLFSRALPTHLEIAMLRGILSQIEWAIQAGNTSSEKPGKAND
jgi:tRNA/rRNA methyltransferase